MLYLDHNATMPMSARVREAVAGAMAEHWANPSSSHALGRKAAVATEEARDRVADFVGVPPHEVTFTSGATEANAWVLSQTTGAVITSAVEHPSVLSWADETIPVSSAGVVDLSWLEERLRQGGVAVVSVMGANNETGVMQPVDEVLVLCRQHGVVFHNDATQLPGKAPLPSDFDWMTLSAHKLGGPRGVGALIAADPPEPLLRGGAQERRRRGGTLNVPGIVGFGAAIEHLTTTRPEQRDHLEALCVELGGQVLGQKAPRLPNTSCALFDVPGDMLAAALDLQGIAVSTGSACASGAHTQSHVLTAMGVEGTPVRFSLGPETDVTRALEVLPEVLGQLRSAML